MASKTAGAAEKMNGGSGKMEDMAVKTEDVAKKSKTIGKEDGGCGEEVEDYRQRRRRVRRGSGRLSAEKTEDVCDKFAPMSQVVGTSVAQLLRKRAMCKWSQNKLLGMAENTTMAAVFA